MHECAVCHKRLCVPQSVLARVTLPDFRFLCERVHKCLLWYSPRRPKVGKQWWRCIIAPTYKITDNMVQCGSLKRCQIPSKCSQYSSIDRPRGRDMGCLLWVLTHRGQVTQICVNKLTIIGPGRHQAIIWTNAGISIIGPLGTKFGKTLIEIHTFSLKEMHLKMPSYGAILSQCVLGHNATGYT